MAEGEKEAKACHIGEKRRSEMYSWREGYGRKSQGGERMEIGDLGMGDE